MGTEQRNPPLNFSLLGPNNSPGLQFPSSVDTGLRLGQSSGFTAPQGQGNYYGLQMPIQGLNQLGRTGNAPAATDNSDWDWMKRGSPLIEGLNTFGNLANAYTSLRQMRLQKDAYNFNKALATTNLGNQATITNAAVEDRTRAAGVQRGLEGETLDNFVREQNRDRYVRGTL